MGRPYARPAGPSWKNPSGGGLDWRPMSAVRVAVAGLGYWGPNLARNFASIPGCELVAVCDADPERVAACVARFPGARGTATLDDILADPAIDAVALATPVPTHGDLAVRVLEAGKHCFVEKPLAITVEEGERLLDEAVLAGLEHAHGQVAGGRSEKHTSELQSPVHLA